MHKMTIVVRPSPAQEDALYLRFRAWKAIVDWGVSHRCAYYTREGRSLTSSQFAMDFALEGIVHGGLASAFRLDDAPGSHVEELERGHMPDWYAAIDHTLLAQAWRDSERPANAIMCERDVQLRKTARLTHPRLYFERDAVSYTLGDGLTLLPIGNLHCPLDLHLDHPIIRVKVSRAPIRPWTWSATLFFASGVTL